MKSTEINIKSMISTKFLMPEKMLKVYLERITIAIPEKETGRKRRELVGILHGIYYMLKTGIQWEALPRIFAPQKTVYDWFAKLSREGLFDETWTYAIQKLQEREVLKLKHQSVDSNHRKALSGGRATGPSPVDRAKPGSKLIIQSDANGLPIGLALASSNCSDQKLLKPVFLDTISRIKRQQNCTFMHLDKGFDSKDNSNFIKSYGMVAVIPSRIYKKRKNLQVVAARDRYRWVIERTISWLGRCKRVFTRYERIERHYLSWAQLAAQNLCFAKL